MAIARRGQQALDGEGAGGSFDPETWRDDLELWWLVSGERFVRRIVAVKVAETHIDDVSQDVLFELVRVFQRGKYEHRSAAEMRGFVRRIVKAQIAQFYAERSRKIDPVMSVEDMPPQFELEDPDVDLDINLEQAEMQRLIRPLLATLPARRRQVIELMFWEELENAEIAARLAISEDLVRQDKRRALQAMRKALEDLGPDLAA